VKNVLNQFIINKQMENLINNIKTIFLWLPIIWKDRQWDSHYYEVMLLHKIKLQRKFFEKRKWFVGWENEVKWMKKCEYLLTMLVNNTYWTDEWDNKTPSRNGFENKYSKIPDYFEKTITSERTKADLWEDKTRILFWKIFVWRYEHWWD